jgi:BRCT domain type II-containing protein
MSKFERLCHERSELTKELSPAGRERIDTIASVDNSVRDTQSGKNPSDVNASRIPSGPSKSFVTTRNTGASGGSSSSVPASVVMEILDQDDAASRKSEESFGPMQTGESDVLLQ